MRFLEELSMNALPSLQTILFDGWVIRFANGYTNRTNSINPIYQSTIDIKQKMDCCERLFRGKGLKPTYKMTPFVSPGNLDKLLAARGYVTINHTSVQTLSLEDLVEPVVVSFKTENDLNQQWFDSYCQLAQINSKIRDTYREMLNNLVSMKFYTSLTLDDQVIACGMAVIENNYIGLFDIIVNEMYRNQGYGRQLLLHLLRLGKSQGAKDAYLQVMLNNHPAIHLYQKLGFKERYQYYYRVLDN